MLGIFLDIETTGLDFRRHNPVEIALILIDLCRGTEVDRYQALIALTDDDWARRDLKAISINGFLQKELACAKSIAVVGDEIKTLFSLHNISRGKAVFICQNPSFDRAFFSRIIETYEQESRSWPYHWLDLASMYWTRAVRDWVLPAEIDQGLSVSKDQIAARLGLPAEAKPHRALNGVLHLLTCYEAVVGFPLQENISCVPESL